MEPGSFEARLFTKVAEGALKEEINGMHKPAEQVS